MYRGVLGSTLMYYVEECKARDVDLVELLNEEQLRALNLYVEYSNTVHVASLMGLDPKKCYHMLLGKGNSVLPILKKHIIRLKREETIGKRVPLPSKEELLSTLTTCDREDLNEALRGMSPDALRTLNRIVEDIENSRNSIDVSKDLKF